jgi:hypothetical protein
MRHLSHSRVSRKFTPTIYSLRTCRGEVLQQRATNKRLRHLHEHLYAKHPLLPNHSTGIEWFYLFKLLEIR